MTHGGTPSRVGGACLIILCMIAVNGSPSADGGTESRMCLHSDPSGTPSQMGGKWILAGEVDMENGTPSVGGGHIWPVKRFCTK